MRALIVDDERDIITMTEIILKKKQIDSDNALTIKDAEKKIQANDYDLFFLDLKLPDGSGFDLITLIRERNGEAGIFIISAYDGHSETSKARDYGVTSFLKKPFNKQDIHDALDDYLEQ